MHDREESGVAGGAADTTPGDSSSRGAGDQRHQPVRIARFVTLGRLGHGGMGVVYAAYDPELDRKVALKLIRSERQTPEATTRFTREARAMARLDHPNVVPIYDVGVHAGQLYIAMAFVAGRTLRQEIEGTKRRWREVVALFSAAAKGLAAAHAEGLVHRDFKPENVLVDERGQVRVTDFGLAKSAQGGADERSVPTDSADLDLTGAATLGTPAYMSPEQIQGDELDPRSDQFSFCVALWEALYGERPFPSGDLVELALAVTTGARRPPPPNSDVPGWLSRIVERGLATVPDERWPDMHALLDAIERGAGRARRRRLVLVAGALAIAGVGAVVADRVGRQRRLADCEQAARSITDVWSEGARTALREGLERSGPTFAASSYERAATDIDRWTGAWTEQRASVCRAATVEESIDAETYARAVACLDDRRSELDALLAVITDPDSETARRIAGAVAHLTPVDPCSDRDVLARRHDLASAAEGATPDQLRRLHRSRALQLTGKYDESLSLARGVADEAQATEAQELAIAAQQAIGNAASAAADTEAAEQAYVQAFELAAGLGLDQAALDAASSLVHTVGYEAGRRDEGVVWSRIARTLVDRLGLENAGAASSLWGSIGSMHAAAGDFDAAEDAFERELAIAEDVFPSDHANLAASLSNLGNLYIQQGRFRDALGPHRRAVEIFEAALGEGHPTLAAAWQNLANAHFALSELEEASALYERALELTMQTQGEEHARVPMLLGNLGNVRVRQGRLDEALLLHQRSLAVRERIYGADDPRIAPALDGIGNVRLARGDYVDAEATLRRVVAIRESELGREHPGYATAIGQLAVVLEALERFAEARVLHDSALTIQEAKLGREHPDVARTLNNLGNLAMEEGRRSEAKELYERALRIREERIGPETTEVATSLNNLAELHLEEGALEVAAPLLERALRIREAVLGPEHADVAEVRFALARAIFEQDPERARALAHRAREECDAAGTGADETADRIDAWLAEHGP